MSLCYMQKIGLKINLFLHKKEFFETFQSDLLPQFFALRFAVIETLLPFRRSS